MKTDERNAIIQIIKLAKIREDELLNSTVFGKRFLERIDEICKSGSEENECILCRKNPASNGIICDVCMEELGVVEKEEKIYCRNCGGLLKAGADSCHVCGFHREEGFNYCSCCGTKITSSFYNELAKDFEDELRDSLNPNAVAQDICKRLGKEFAIRKSNRSEDIFFDYDYFELVNKEKQFCHIEITSFKDKTVSIAFDSEMENILVRGAKILIRMMEPDISDFEINDIFTATKESSFVYYYNGICYDFEESKFAAGTEAYGDEISANLDHIVKGYDVSGNDVSEWLGMTEDMLKNSDVKAEIVNGRVVALELCSLGDENIAGIMYGMPEHRALEIMKESCSNIYLDTEKRKNDRYSYKGQIIVDGRYANLTVEILCGHVLNVNMTLENM